MNTRAKHITHEIIAIGFIILFAYTGISKLMEVDRFMYSLKRSPALSSYSSVIAILLPALELALAFFLIFPRRRKLMFLIATFLMTTFTLYIGLMLIFVEELPCSCGGVISQLSWKNHLVFNMVFLLLGLIGFQLSNTSN